MLLNSVSNLWSIKLQFTTKMKTFGIIFCAASRTWIFMKIAFIYRCIFDPSASRLIVIRTSHFSKQHKSHLAISFTFQMPKSGFDVSDAASFNLVRRKTMQNFLAPNDTRKCLISLDNDALFWVPSVGSVREHLRPGRKCFHSKISNFDPLNHVSDFWLTHLQTEEVLLHFQMRCFTDAHVIAEIYPNCFPIQG